MMNTKAQPTPQWYAVYTYPKVEKKVHQEITKLGVETYLPLQKVVKQWSDRKKRTEAPLFPNYIFVKTTLQERFDIFKVKGLVRFVTFEGSPVAIPEQEIDTIKKMTGQEGLSLEHHPSAGVGEPVRITSGQFAGTEGIIVREAGGKSRFIVRIKALRQTVSVNITSDQVIPLN